jgi:hypothetical protein
MEKGHAAERKAEVAGELEQLRMLNSGGIRRPGSPSGSVVTDRRTR